MSSNDILREAALLTHIGKLPANLLREYALELVKDAPPAEVDKLVVAFRAQGNVPAKETGNE